MAYKMLLVSLLECDLMRNHRGLINYSGVLKGFLRGLMWVSGLLQRCSKGISLRNVCRHHVDAFRLDLTGDLMGIQPTMFLIMGASCEMIHGYLRSDGEQNLMDDEALEEIG